MTRLGMVAAAAATLAAVVLAPTVGQAQSVDAAARDLRTHDVTFENGAVTDQDLADLDRVTAQLQADGGYTKVVVLAHPVDTSSSARAFAGKVLDTLGGRGRGHRVRPAGRGHRHERPRRGVEGQQRRAGRHRRRQPLQLLRHRRARRRRHAGRQGLGGQRLRHERQRRRTGPRSARRLDREHPAGRAPRGRRGAGRRRVLLLVVVAQAEGRRRGVERLPGRGRADRAGRGRGDVEPGHRPGRSDRGARRAGRGGHRVP